MKKVFIGLMLILLLAGCGSKKTTKKIVKEEEPEEIEEITLQLGGESMTFKEEAITCGNYQIQSNVVFSNEQDENGEYKGSYEFYECNDGNVNLQTALGTYRTNGYNVIFTDSYEQKLNFEITSNNTVVQKDGSSNIRTLTK